MPWGQWLLGFFLWFLLGSFFFFVCGEVFFLVSFSLLFIFWGVWGFGRFYFLLEYDFLGFSMVELSIFILYLIFMVGLNNFGGMSSYRWFWLGFYFLLFFLVLSFGVLNWFSLYFLFECCILPTFFLIMGWGLGDGRVQASFYLFFYTVFFSLPFFFVLFYLHKFGSSLFIGFHFYFSFLNFWGVLGILSLLIFLSKLPVFFLHVWLPKAHVEAPLGGSMVLAGVLLKLGGYGILRLLFSYYYFILSFIPFLYSLGLFGGLLSAVSCFRQVDMKRLVAFMSVSHMGLMLSGILSMTSSGFMGGIYFMLGHGLASSGLFGCVTYFYDRFSSRSIVILKGGIDLWSSLALFLFFLCLLNLSFPPSLNFFAELFVVFALLSYWLSGMFLVFLVVLLGCLGTIHLYTTLAHGDGPEVLGGEDLGFKSSVYFFLHLFPSWVFFVFFI